MQTVLAKARQRCIATTVLQRDTLARLHALRNGAQVIVERVAFLILFPAEQSYSRRD
tara:strand:- start:134 stop:304 length:171 start_codon:yes stop_codon:yes gene_type:complete